MSAAQRQREGAAFLVKRRRAYTPTSEPSLIEGWDARSAGLVPGTIGSWTGVKGTVATLTGTTRVFSLTSIVDDEGGTHPGVQMGGAIMTCPISLAGLSKVAVIVAFKDFSAGGTCVLYEYCTTAWTDAGAIGCGLNISNAGDFDVETTRGGQGRWTAPAGSLQPDPFVLTAVHDTASASGSSSRRIDNVEVLGGSTPATSVTAGGLGSYSFYFGARPGGTSAASLIAQQVWLLNNPDEATLTRVARYAAAGVGQVAA